MYAVLGRHLKFSVIPLPGARSPRGDRLVVVCAHRDQPPSVFRKRQASDPLTMVLREHTQLRARVTIEGGECDREDEVLPSRCI